MPANPVQSQSGQTKFGVEEGSFKTNTKEMANEAMDKVRSIAGDLADRASKVEKSAEEMISKHPFESLLIGFGVGFATAILLRKATA